MQTVTTISALKEALATARADGRTVGLVPTMGYLHEGHASLIDAARATCDVVVVSAFVNPIQFGPNEDFDSYPRDEAHDAAICAEHGADFIFRPTSDDMYPDGFSSFVEVEHVTDGLCGARRPGHFRGVCTVVTKLFNIVEPDIAFFGQKDAQQLAVIRRMVADLNMNVRIVGCPIVREDDGLAKSSRNTYLSQAERSAALVLSRALAEARSALGAGERDAETLREIMRRVVEQEPLARIDYLEVVDGLSMQPITEVTAPALIALAVYIGDTRLIDNFLYEEDSPCS